MVHGKTHSRTDQYPPAQRNSILMALVLAGTLAVAISRGVAEETAPTASPASAPKPSAVAPATPAPAEEAYTLRDYWAVGGWCMYPITLLSIAMVGLTVYGFILVQERKMLTPQLVGPLTEALKGLRLDDAISMCTTTPSLLTNILHAGLQRISKGVLDINAMEKAMEESSAEETAQGLRMISYLSVVASTAPMWGLLGTVSGMVKAFEKIGRGAMGKPELLAKDIGEALITTFAGLVVGIPAMCFYFYLKSRYTENLTRLGRILGNLTNALVAASREATGGEVPVESATPVS